MRAVLCIGLGGFVGALCRHYVALGVVRYQGESNFPLGIFAANVTGCLLIGILMAWSEHSRFFGTEMKLFVFTGLLGSFTTFSTFGYNTFDLLRRGEIATGLANIGFSVIAGLAAVWIGYSLVTLAKQ